jgi:hypothetical protein
MEAIDSQERSIEIMRIINHNAKRKEVILLKEEVGFLTKKMRSSFAKRQ